jgi:hypothetical protein
MGYIRHHTIVLTHWQKEKIVKAHKKALEIFDNQLVSDLVEGTRNEQVSFFIAPDGSKEFWPESYKFDKCRKDFITFLNSNKEVEWIKWVEVSIGDDNIDEDTRIKNYTKKEEIP